MKNLLVAFLMLIPFAGFAQEEIQLTSDKFENFYCWYSESDTTMELKVQVDTFYSVDAAGSHKFAGNVSIYCDGNVFIMDNCQETIYESVIMWGECNNGFCITTDQAQISFFCSEKQCSLTVCQNGTELIQEEKEVKTNKEGLILIFTKEF